MLLAHAMDAGTSLFIVAHRIIQRVEDHGGGRRQRYAQTRRGDLAHEHLHLGIVLKGFDLGGTVGHAAVNHGVAKAFLYQQFLNGVDFRQEPGNDHHLVAVIFRAIQQI